jgi:hypothetical protein
MVALHRGGTRNRKIARNAFRTSNSPMLSQHDHAVEVIAPCPKGVRLDDAAGGLHGTSKRAARSS